MTLITRALDERDVLHVLNSLFDPLTYIVGTQKNRLNVTVLLSTNIIGFSRDNKGDIVGKRAVYSFLSEPLPITVI